MGRKKIQFFVFAVIVLIVGGTAWYLFQQSSRFKALDDRREQQNASSVQKEKPEFKIVHSGNRTEQTKPSQAAPVQAPGQGQAQANATLSPDQEQEVQERKEPSWIKDFVVTSTFVQDLAGYLVKHYQPPATKDNPGQQGRISVSFKSLNARYGLELIGLRHSGGTLKKARQEVLGKLMNPDLLREAYDRYSATFLDTLVAKARKTEKEPLDGRMQALSKEEIAEMLRLNSAYLGDVAGVLESLVSDPALPRQVERYLQAEKAAVHANFVLNQEQNRYDILLQSSEKAAEDREVTRQKIDQAESRKDEAARSYRTALQKRELERRELLDMIAVHAGDVSLEQHEILYIAEWVFRRFESGQESGALEVASSLLQDLSARFSARAQGLVSQGEAGQPSP